MQQKFENFKAFVESEVPGSAVTFLLGQADLQTFIAIIIKMVNEHEPCDHDGPAGGVTTTRICSHHAAGIILERLGLNPESFSAAARVKLELYCEYFLWVISAGSNSAQ